MGSEIYRLQGYATRGAEQCERNLIGAVFTAINGFCDTEFVVSNMRTQSAALISQDACQDVRGCVNEQRDLAGEPRTPQGFENAALQVRAPTRR